MNCILHIVNIYIYIYWYLQIDIYLQYIHSDRCLYRMFSRCTPIGSTSLWSISFHWTLMQGASDLNGQSLPFQQISTYFDSGIGRGLGLDVMPGILLDNAKARRFCTTFHGWYVFFPHVNLWRLVCDLTSLKNIWCSISWNDWNCCLWLSSFLYGTPQSLYRRLSMDPYRCKPLDGKDMQTA